MPVSLARSAVWAICAVLVLAILLVIGLPIVASTQIVRDGIAYQMSAWSGYRVRLDDAPDIHVWPDFRAVLHDVSLLDWSETEPRPVLQAERIEAALSPLAALRGDIVFTDVRFVRPVLRMQGGGAGPLRLPTPQSWGKLNRSIEAARAAVAKEPARPDVSELPSDSLGEVEFVDARVVAVAPEGQVDIVTSLTGALDWPALNRQATLSAKGIWQGEAFTLQATADQPLLLMGGGNGDIDLTFHATPVDLSFKGAVNIGGAGFADGQFTLTAPSLSRLVAWTHAISLPSGRLGSVSLSGHINGDINRLKLENATLAFDNSTGKGLLDVALTPGRPSLAGTLAFDTLALQPLLNLLGPYPLDAQGRIGQVAPAAQSIDFDLRISAANATIGAATLTNVAAAAKVKGHHATFDISDATAFGGTFQLGMRADRSGAKDAIELRVMGDKVDIGRLAASLGMQRLIPHAPAAFSAALKGSGPNLESLLASAEGTVSLAFGAGTIPGLSVETLLRRSAVGDFFPLSTLAGDTLPIDGAEIKAQLAKGVAQIERAEIRSGAYRIAIDGLVPIPGRALALYGTLAEAESATPEPREPLMFFVGGSWSAPFVSSFVPPARGMNNQP